MNKNMNKRAMSKGGIVWTMLGIFVLAMFVVFGTGVVKLGNSAPASTQSLSLAPQVTGGVQSQGTNAQANYQPTANLCSKR